MKIITLDQWDFWPGTRWDEIPAKIVALRCTEGTETVDSHFVERQKEAENHGFRVLPLHIVTSEDARLQKSHFQDISKVPEGSRIVLELADNAALSDLRDSVMAWNAWGMDSRPVTIRGGDRLRELLDGLHDPILQRADLWILENATDEPLFPTHTWATWTLRELPRTDDGPPASVFNGEREAFLEWLG